MVPIIRLSQCPSLLPLSLVVLASSLNVGLVRGQTIDQEGVRSQNPESRVLPNGSEKADSSVASIGSSDRKGRRDLELGIGEEGNTSPFGGFKPLSLDMEKKTNTCRSHSVHTGPPYFNPTDESLGYPSPQSLTPTPSESCILSSSFETSQAPSPVTPPPRLPNTPPSSDIPPFPPDRQQPPSQTPPETQTPSPLPPPDQLLQPPPSTPPTPEAVPGKVPESISVERFEVEGSTVFSREEFDKVLAPFTKRSLSFAELFQARSAVTQLYLDRGYITSGALIPPQTLNSGVIKIQVIEGGLEAINVTGTRRLNADYVRSRLAIATSKPLKRERLLEALQLLQLNPLIQNLSAELAAGTEPGLSLLEVKVTEAKTFSAQLSADNNRTPSVGTFRRRGQLTEANLLGQGDSLIVGYSNTDGSNGVDLTYTLPINPRNGTLSFSYGNTSSDVIERPFDVLDINSNSSYYELTLRQPVLQTPTQEFAFGLTATRQESKIEFLEGLPFPALGADDEGRTRISAVRFFQEWTKRNSREVIAARSQFSFGVGAFNSTINDEAPDSRFFSWRGQAQWVRLLAADTLLLVRADMQLADRTLLPLEQFGLGGQETIRGYRQDFLLTDNAALASAEVRIPILRLKKLNALLQIAPFFDVGTGWNNSGRPDPDPNFLASTGLGLRLQLGDRLTVRLDYGIPLVSASSSERTWQENGFYFSIVGSPF